MKPFPNHSLEKHVPTTSDIAYDADFKLSDLQLTGISKGYLNCVDHWLLGEKARPPYPLIHLVCDAILNSYYVVPDNIASFIEKKYSFYQLYPKLKEHTVACLDKRKIFGLMRGDSGLYYWDIKPQYKALISNVLEACANDDYAKMETAEKSKKFYYLVNFYTTLNE